jgi:hypothetical protein
MDNTPVPPLPPEIPKEIVPQNEYNIPASNAQKSIEERTLIYAWETAKQTRKLATWTKILGVFTGIVALFAVASTIVTTIAVNDAAKSGDSTLARMDSQLKEQRNFDTATTHRIDAQISISRETMQKQLRAYVAIYLDQDTIGNYNRMFYIQNNGLTPAYKVSFWFATKAKMLSPKPSFSDRPHGDSSRITLSPGRDNRRSFFSDFLSNQYTDNMIKGKKAAIFIYGEIRYEDAFGDSCYTRFRYKYGIPNSPYIPMACSEGNESN